jgi:site-specific recombinase XerD
MAYKQRLIEKGYAVGSVNSMLASLNSFLRFLGWEDCRVRQLRTQKKIYSQPEQELTKSEYQRLVAAASGRPRLGLILQTICCTGIRVSELRYFTVEQVRQGEVTVSCKNKTRTVLLPARLKAKLLRFAKNQGIETGVVFRTRSGRPVDRSNIWSDMKSLCEKAQVAATKVFPHNLRKLFARTFYELDKDVAKLADILGHSSINTTRIYLMSTGKEHRKKIERLGLLL